MGLLEASMVVRHFPRVAGVLLRLADSCLLLLQAEYRNVSGAENRCLFFSLSHPSTSLHPNPRGAIMWEACWDLNSLGVGDRAVDRVSLAESNFEERRFSGGYSTTYSRFVGAASGSPGCPVPEAEQQGSVPWVGDADSKGDIAVL